MKVHLERAAAGDVQTFAPECEPEEHQVAILLGWPGAEEMFVDLVQRSRESFAMKSEDRTRVVAMAGVLKRPIFDLVSPGQLWLHMPPAFRSAGFGALRLARQLIDRLLVDYGGLEIDIDSQRPELVRMADWLGFKHVRFTTKFERVFHHCVLRRAA